MNDGDATLIDIPSSKLLLRSTQTREEFAITGEMIVGRSSVNDIHLDDISISRQHAKLTTIAGAVIVEDLNSTNGTAVNGKKISVPQQLEIGDELRFHKFAFRLAEHVEEEATVLDVASSAPASLEPKIEIEIATPEQERFSANVVSKASAVEEALEPGADRTQTMSPQKVRLLAQRAALAKSPVTAGSGTRLVILTAPLRGKVFSLPVSVSLGTQVNIGRGGRSNKLNIMLDDKTVSQDHAKLELTTQGWTIIPSNPRNATMVNGEVATNSSLQHQDTITVGRIELAFLTDERDEPPAIAAANQARPVNKRSKGRRVARVILFLTLVVALILVALFALPTL